jgi:hypothetical protein
MNTNTKNPISSAVAEQTQNNTTGWIGHIPGDNKHIVRGQTFISNAEGDLEAIEVYSNMVKDPGKVVMTVHNFDPQQKSWGPALASSSVEFKKADAEKWMTFHIPGLHLHKGNSYGFRIETNESLIGIGEAVRSANQPPLTGQEWKFTGNNQKGDAYSYISLAFKVDVKAA